MVISDVIERQIKGLWGTDFSDEENGVPVIKTNNLSYEGRIDFGEICYRNIDEESAKANYLHKGDLLVEKSGGTKTHTVGYVNHYDGDDDVFVCNNFILGLRPKKELVNYMYLFYQLRYMYGLGLFLDCYNKTTGIQNLQVRAYLGKNIIVPKLAEQDAIVKVLDTIQHAIDLKRKQLTDLDELVKSKFQEMFGDLRINEKKWSFVPLMEICDVRDGTHESPKYHLLGYPLLTSKNFTGGTIDFDNVNLISKEDYDAINVRSKVDIGDIVLPMIGTIGHPVVINVEPEFAIKNVALIKFKDSKYINYFIKQVLDSEYFMMYVSLNNKGNTQKFVSLGDIRKFPIPIVPSSSQISFGNYVQKVDKAMLLLNQEVACLEELMDLKMDEYFGEKDEP